MTTSIRWPGRYEVDLAKVRRLVWLSTLMLASSSSAAQVLPCTPSVPGCLDNVPFFYLVASPPAPQPQVIRATCPDVATCVRGAFVGVTGVDPGDLVGSELRREIVDFPVASPSGGFSIVFSKRDRAYQPMSMSYGPTYAERALTQGRRALSGGVDYQFHSYSRIIGSNQLEGTVAFLYGNQPLWSRTTSFDMTRHVLNSHVSYGLTDHIDVSAQVPLIATNIEGTLVEGIPGRAPELQYAFSGVGTGIGDFVLSIKAATGRHRSTSSEGSNSVDWMRFGLLATFTFATGSQTKLTGVGYSRAKLTAVWSGNPTALVQPHLNAGMTLPLATDVANLDINLRDYSTIPRVLETVVGMDIAPNRWFTTSVDVMMRRAFNSARVEYGSVDPAIVLGILIDGRVRCCVDGNRTFYPIADDVTNGIVSIGGKVNVAPHTLIVGNVVLPFGRYTILPRPTINVGLTVGR